MLSFYWDSLCYTVEMVQRHVKIVGKMTFELSLLIIASKVLSDHDFLASIYGSIRSCNIKFSTNH